MLGPVTPATRVKADPEPREPVPLLREARYSQSLERGLAILECFTPDRPVLGIAELADELGMSRSTTHRYAITLVALGYLEQGVRRKYRLGLRVIDLGMSALHSTDLREHARPHLEELRGRSSHTVAIAVLDEAEIVYIDILPAQRRGQSAIEPGLAPGARLPAHCLATGKLLMANLPVSERRRLVAELKLSRRGPNTIAGKGALRTEFEQILEEGLAISDQELAPDLYEIAAPVRNEQRETIAAVSMAAHSSAISLGQLVEHLSPHLVSTADRISARLGYRRDDERLGITSLRG